MKRILVILLCCTWTLSASILANPFLVKSGDKNKTNLETAVGAPAEKKISDLLELLGEEEVQGWLRKQLEKKEAESAAGVHSELSPQDWMTTRLAALEDNLAALRMATTEVPAQFEQFKANWIKELGDGDTLRSLVYVIVFLTIGFGIEWLYWCYTSSIRGRLTLSGGVPMLPQLAKYSLLKALGIGFFALGALGSFMAFSWKPLVELLVITLLLAIVISRVLQLVVYFLLNPHETDRRPFPVSAKAARHLYWWGMVIIVAAVFGFFLTAALEEMGFAPGVALLLKAFVAMTIALLFIGVVWDWYIYLNRYESEKPTGYPGRVQASQIVPMIATLIILVELALWVIGARILSWSLLLMVLMLVLDKGSRMVIRSTINRQTRSSPEKTACCCQLRVQKMKWVQKNRISL